MDANKREWERSHLTEANEENEERGDGQRFRFQTANER
jgi:hypothetical protein